nr:MAG TPA: hypothetical protein [Caudoviricetes sp.]
MWLQRLRAIIEGVCKGTPSLSLKLENYVLEQKSN